MSTELTVETNGVANVAGDRSYIDVENSSWEINQFSFPKQYQGFVEKVLLPHGLIIDRIERLAQDIVTEVFELQDSPKTDVVSPRLTWEMVAKSKHHTALNHPRLHVLCILKGGYKFFSDLMDCITRLIRSIGLIASVSVDFIRVKSYMNDKSTGKVNIIGGDVLESLEGKTVLIVEDLIDTGRTMETLTKTLKDYKPARLLVACLILKNTEKRKSGELTYWPDFLGFKVPDQFIVGYATDYNEFFRDLHHICIVNDAGKEFFKYPPPPAEDEGEKEETK